MKLSKIQHCPVHGCDIIASETSDIVLFRCAESSSCMWVSDNNHELRRKHNSILHIQGLIDSICKHYPESKTRKSIVSMCSKIVAYL